MAAFRLVLPQRERESEREREGCREGGRRELKRGINM